MNSYCIDKVHNTQFIHLKTTFGKPIQSII